VIHPDLKLPRDEIAEFCRRHHIKTLSLFGSATKGDFRPDSDVDFMTDFDPEVSIGLAEYLPVIPSPSMGNGIKLSNEALDIALKPECARMSELGTFHPSPGTLACGIGLKQVVQFRPYRF
jgi:hypothetical protein